MIDAKTITAGLMAAALALAPSAAMAQDAKAILKAMSDYVGSQQNISLSYDSAIEVVTPQIEKIQFTSSGSMQLTRPDKLHATRTGGYVDVELTYDGKTVSVLGKNIKGYAQHEASGSLDQLIEKLRNDLGVELPGADLLAENAFEVLSPDIIEAKHIGQGVVNGTECEHLAFRNHDTDWQLWVELGERPFPRKYVITSKTVAGAPEYTLVIKEWKPSVDSADAYTFKAPDDAKKVELTAISELDEVPQGKVGEK